MIIATGSVYTEDKAKAWLVAHGAHITSGGVVDLIELPKEGRLEVLRAAHDWQYCIVAYDAVGNDEPQYVEVEHDIDATETILRLKGEAPEPTEDTCNTSYAEMQDGEIVPVHEYHYTGTAPTYEPEPDSPLLDCSPAVSA